MDVSHRTLLVCGNPTDVFVGPVHMNRDNQNMLNKPIKSVLKYQFFLNMVRGPNKIKNTRKNTFY